MRAVPHAPFKFRCARRRRILFFGATAGLFAAGFAAMFSILSESGWNFLSILLLVLFVPLFAQIVFGFMLAAAGYVLLRRGGDPWRINDSPSLPSNGNGSAAAAIVMPIFNEDVSRVFQGLKVMYESLQKTDRGGRFDLFILSDSDDVNNWIAEEMAWMELCKQAGGFGRIFYRKRRVALHHKSGNIADFCRRWGGSYRYMVVLDADSIMTGPAIARLMELMERNSRIGIIQTFPRLVLGTTIFQRIMQFSSRVYSPLFAAGMNFWQLESGNYWGHNAIIRLRPFLKHCAMPELPEGSPLGRRILSHDTIEAALMRRFGYEVWSAYDLEGSYEEGPPHLIASLQRDQRWCFGNLQHVWLLFKPGIKMANRLHILNGVMNYANALIWLLFLAANTVLAVLPASARSAAHPLGQTASWLLLAGVFVLLLLPKFLGAALLWSDSKLAAYGGRAKLCLSLAAEIVFSSLLAPILMLFYTRFVLAAFSGAPVKWTRQDRAAGDGLSWRSCCRIHWGHCLIALGWAAWMGWQAPVFLAWIMPVLLGLLAAIPLTHVAASTVRGQQARKKNWFLIPEETDPPKELQEVQEPFVTPAAPFFLAREYAGDYGLLQAVLDPYVNSVHISLLRHRVQASPQIREYVQSLGERLLLDGPVPLTAQEKRTLLWDAEAMIQVHRKLWSSPPSDLHDWWQAALRRYNETSALASRRMASRA